MADMDLDELDGPIRAPPRTSRFAPKASKLKPKPKSEPQSVPIPPPKPEPESEPSISSVSEAVEMDVQAKAVDDTVKMDIKEGEADDSGKDSAVEENDCVVREIDVFFNPVIDPATQLYALQYPLRPCWRPYELEERCVEVRLKPTSNEVEIDLSLDADSKNYDTDGDRKMSMKKETLSSSMKPIGAKGIAIGMLMGNKLHINPIRAAVQLRPSRKSAVSMKKTGVPRNKDDIVKSEDLKDEKSPGPSRKQLQNKPPGIPNEDDDIVEEDWIPLKHYPANSEFSARYLGKMAGTESSPIQFSMSTYNYINSMCPGANSDYNKPIGIALRSLHSLPLEERFGTWLREHPPANRFATLKHLAPDDSIEDVFNALQKVACLVQGLWVPKSAVLLGGGLEVLARDYVLLLFCRSPTISYNLLDNLKPKVSKAIKGVLSTLANDRSTLRDWKFKETPDTTFVKLYPDIVIQQEQNWKRVEKQITETLLGPERAAAAGKPPLKADLASKAGAPKTSGSKATARSSSGVVSRTPMSDETREALPKALLKLFHTHKVCSFQVICQRLREMAVSESARPKGMAREAIAAANAVDGPQEELMEIINQVATNIHGVYVLKKSPDDPQSDPLRKVVIDLLLAEGPNAKLKKASVLAAAKMQLKKDVSDPEYNKVLKELCVSQGATWVLKRGDGNPIPK